MSKTKKPYQRKIILINKPFQLKMSFILTSWIVALTYIYPLLVFNIFNGLVLSLSHPRLEEVALLIRELNELVFTRTLLIYFAFGVLTFLLSLYVSHKIAGPLYKLRSAMENFTSSREYKKIYFRKSDYFAELANSYNELTEKISIKDKAHTEAIEKIYPSLSEENKKIMDEVLSDIRANA